MTTLVVLGTVLVDATTQNTIAIAVVVIPQPFAIPTADVLVPTIVITIIVE